MFCFKIIDFDIFFLANNNHFAPGHINHGSLIPANASVSNFRHVSQLSSTLTIIKEIKFHVGSLHQLADKFIGKVSRDIFKKSLEIEIEFIVFRRFVCFWLVVKPIVEAVKFAVRNQKDDVGWLENRAYFSDFFDDLSHVLFLIFLLYIFPEVFQSAGFLFLEFQNFILSLFFIFTIEIEFILCLLNHVLIFQEKLFFKLSYDDFC